MSGTRGKGKRGREIGHRPKLNLATLPEGQLLSNNEAAACLGVAPTTLLNWRYRECGPSYYKIGRLAFYRASDLLVWLAKQRRDPVATRERCLPVAPA
jgi:hypothetical protein